MRWRRFVLWSVLAAVLLAGLAYAFWPRPIPVDLAEAASGPLVVTVDEEGETRVRDIFVLSAPVTGRLRRIEREVGDQVIAGVTVVANIEPADPAFLDLRSEGQARAAVNAAEAAQAVASAELVEAKAELEFAEAEVERARRLIRTGTIPQRALDVAERVFRTRRAAVTTAEAALRVRDFELDRARANLVSPGQTQQFQDGHEYVPILAPVSGRILRLLQESEGVVQVGEALVEIGNPEDLEIVADFLSSDAVRIKPGQRVSIEEWGGPTALAGAVRRVEPYGFTKVSALGIEEQRVNVIVDFSDPAEDWQRLGHGYRVEVRVVLWEGRDVLKVPLTALFRDGEHWALFVAENGRARMRTVELGQRNGLEAEIVSGVSAGEQVVLHPSNRIVEGAPIAARP